MPRWPDRALPTPPVGTPSEAGRAGNSSPDNSRLAGLFNYLTPSSKKDLTEIADWLESGKIDRFELYAGEIFPGSYGDEYEQFIRMCDAYDGCRLVVAKNHSKITLCKVDDYAIVVESSANVNTNPRIEQSTLHNNPELHAFYHEFFAGIKSIDRATKTH